MYFENSKRYSAKTAQEVSYVVNSLSLLRQAFSFSKFNEPFRTDSKRTAVRSCPRNRADNK